MSDENRQWRAQTYALLARLLASPADQTLLENIAAIQITEPESPMGKNWQALVDASIHADISTIEDDFQTLFIGVTHGELIPYGSFYLTGFLMEEPLAELRKDLAKLGLERQQDKTEPEDHIAAECDVMRLILMAQGEPVVSDSNFFSAHLKPWAELFFQDLAKNESSAFYQAVGQFGLGFIQLENLVYH